MNLSIAIDSVDGVKVIHVGGEVDVYTAPRLKEALAEALEGRDRSCSTSPRCTSSTRPVWEYWSRPSSRPSADSRDFHLVVDDPYLLKIFRITGFDGVFSIYPQVTDAVHNN